ncbi:MAG: hypothetical protein GEU86_08250 [Actinophytocola sp.]|nr:hypothetical protein [Actinophytocola sp.]
MCHGAPIWHPGPPSAPWARRMVRVADSADSARWRFCGRVGQHSDHRVAAMSALLGELPVLMRHEHGSLQGTSAVSWTATAAAADSASSGVSWSPAPLPATLPPDPAVIAERHDACSLVVGESGEARLHAGISGAVPIYADLTSNTTSAVHFCTHVDPLARTSGTPLRPDWDAWAHILAMGAPLAGRTTFAGIRRLPPWGRLTVPPGGRPDLAEDGWPWLDIDGGGEGSLDAVRDALVDTVGALAGRGPLTSLLSGGWDSRILTTLAANATAGEQTAWTTSSDTGMVLEELVAAQVAERLGIRHRVIQPHRSDFAADLDHFARSVDYQTSFHVWLVSLARTLADVKGIEGIEGTVLDGLGGGVFVGGAFPDDDSSESLLAKRFDRMARYLKGAGQILHPRVIEQIRERSRSDFEPLATPLADHPYGSTFTAYLARTLPGISLAPFGLVARSAPIATPFLNDRVVRAALAIRPDKHADGSLYAPLLRPLAPELAELPTAADLTPARRAHRRRVSSIEAAEHFRSLLTREPIRRLLAPGLAEADLSRWQSRLDNTGFQHLIRGLATLALWLERYDGLLDDASTDTLLESVG